MAKKPELPELSATASIKLMKDIFKNKKTLTPKDLRPGKMLTYFYNAKDKSNTYDKTPLVFVLRRNKTHTLGLNIHWLPFPLRQVLIKKILGTNSNKKNIKAKKPLEFSYKNLKPFLKRLGYAPVIRLYINKRISKKGVIVPDDMLLQAARIKSETFTQGKVSAETMYRKAIKGNINYRKSRFTNRSS